MGRSACAYVVLCSLWLVASATPAGAQDAATSSTADAIPVATLAEAGAAAAAAAPVAAPQFPVAPSAPAAGRPGALVPLYVSFGSLQALDVHSTTRALYHGAVEANPMMKGLAGNPVAFAAAKVAGSAGVIYAAEKMRKKHRKAAVVFMVAANAALALVVSHNYRQP